MQLSAESSLAQHPGCSSRRCQSEQIAHHSPATSGFACADRVVVRFPCRVTTALRTAVTRRSITFPAWSRASSRAPGRCSARSDARCSRSKERRSDAGRRHPRSPRSQRLLYQSQGRIHAKRQNRLDAHGHFKLIVPDPRRYAPATWPASRGTGGRIAAEQVAGFDWNSRPESAEYA